MSKSLIVLSILFVSLASSAQTKVFTGVIRDGVTNEPLQAANIQITGTYSGTISNEDGVYLLSIEQLPAHIRVRYIGYISREILITEDSVGVQDIYLEPTVLEAEPIVIIGEDPAIQIMRKVIERKQTWYPRLNTYEADAYSRLLIENEEGIVSIMESTSEIFWDRDRGARELVISKHHTSNIRQEDVFASASMLPNLYDDDIEMMGFDVIGVTHPDALKHYDFKLVDERYIDDKLVFDISVTPKGKLQPTLVGRISVLDEEFAVIDVDVRLNPELPYPWPIKKFDASYKQQFNDFGQDYWLPVDIRIDGYVCVGIVGLEFPRIGFRQISRISDYLVNVELPDSLYESETPVRADSAKIAAEETLVEELREIPLSVEEEGAYATIDSTMSLRKAFQPKGFLARFAKIKVETGEGDEEEKPREDSRDQASGPAKKRFRGFRPLLWHNRADDFHLGAAWKRRFGKRLSLELRGGYKTGPKDWSYGGTCRVNVNKRGTLFVETGLDAGTLMRQPSELYGTISNSLLTILGYEDYFDYYRIQGGTCKIGYEIRPMQSRLEVGFRAEDHESLEKSTDWNLFGRDHSHRENPAIDDGKLRSLEVSLEAGESVSSWGVVGQRFLKLQVEHSSPDILDSDFDFSRYHLRFDWRLPTFLKRRPLSNVLDLRVVAGTTTGTAPLQRLGALDTSFGIIAPFGAFKTLRAHPLEGEDYLGVFWEHNFRTVPFEILGLKSLVRNNISLILTGASGRTWISEKRLAGLSYDPHYRNEFHHEIGISINGILGIVRIDLATPIGDDTVFGRVSVARMF